MTPTTPLADAISLGPVILDGGLATLLEDRGHDLSSRLWSAQLLRDDPGAIEAAHREFFAAGAQVAIAASYQASFEGFTAAGIEHAEAERLMRRSVELARAARDAAAPGGWVAASVGPYGAYRADGSEYHGHYGLSVGELRGFHRERLQVLADAGADVLAIETIPSLAEVEAVLAELAGTGHPAWLSVTCRDGRTRHGEPVAEAFAMAADVAEVIAVGLNCSSPAEVVPVIEEAVAVRPGIAYPNSGQGWDGNAHRWLGERSFDAEAVDWWVGAGARLVGGCCRVGPGEIARLAAVVHHE